MKQDGWETVSNIAAIIAAIAPMQYLVLPRNDIYVARYVAVLICIIFLVISMLSARKIPGCKAPFRRTLFMWCVWSFSLVGLVAPLALLLRDVPLYVVWPPVIYSIPFGLGAVAIWWSSARVGGNGT